MDPVSFPEAAAFARKLYDAAQAKNYALLAVLVLVILVGLLRRFGARRFPILGTDAGGALLLLLTGTVGGVATALASGSPLTLGLVGAVFSTVFAASGGYTMVKRHLPALLRFLKQERLAKLVELAFELLAPRKPAPAVIVEAQKAGEARAKLVEKSDFLDLGKDR